MNEPEENMKVLVATTMKALTQKFRYSHVRSGHYLAGRSATPEIYGEDAARDFIETKWPAMFKHLLEMAEARHSSATVNFPETGNLARKTIIEYIERSLPGCQVRMAGYSMNIDWAKLVTQPEEAE